MNFYFNDKLIKFLYITLIRVIHSVKMKKTKNYVQFVKVILALKYIYMIIICKKYSE